MGRMGSPELRRPGLELSLLSLEMLVRLWWVWLPTVPMDSEMSPAGAAGLGIPGLTRGVPASGVPLEDPERLTGQERAKVDARVFHEVR